MTLKTINEVEQELERFSKRLQEAKTRIQGDNIEEKSIDEFSDNELMEEIRDRKLLGGDNSIISEQFITRFSKIIEKENQILLDSLLTEFENKLNI